MKQRKNMIIAVLCGALCAICVFAYTQSVRSESDSARAEAMARYGGDQSEVLVATKDISAGDKVDSTNTTKKFWLVDLLPSGAVENTSELSSVTATSSIGAGEVLTQKRFEGESGGISVPKGLQAVSIDVKKAQSVGDALEAGMNVDVYSVGSSGAQLLASDVLVLAQGASSGSQKWVTLAIRSEQVQEVIATTQKAELYLTLPGSYGEGKDS